MLASTVAPRPTNKKLKRRSKVPLDSGSYVLAVQPKDLPKGWEQAIVLNSHSGTGVYVYHNPKENLSQLADPRPPPKSKDSKIGPLPLGWSQEVDEDGDPVFEDHNSGRRTYDDPRLVCSVSAELQPEIHSDQLHLPPVLEGTATSPLKLPWSIGVLDLTAFDALPQKLTPKERLPAEVVTKKLNRYTNILPNPRTRVRLAEGLGVTALDGYINANYVGSCGAAAVENPHEYIAAMGPLPNTCADFWKMIWENNCAGIVMTTALVENGIQKCARYWPAVRYNEQKKVGDMVFGTLRVAVLAGERWPGYVRTFLRVTDGIEERHVSHFWFTEWPDHGVPANLANVLQMLKTVRQHSKDAGGVPTVVHCSAGIGRTGSFIAIDLCAQMLEAQQTTNVLEIISKLRDARGGMVQHPQQYEFVYRAVMEFARQQNHPMVTLPSAHVVVNTAKVLEAALARADGLVPEDYVHPSQRDEAMHRAEAEQALSVKQREEQQLLGEVKKGKPEDMTPAEWGRLKRQAEKIEAQQRAKMSIRRRLSDAELHGELRLGTISRGQKDRAAVYNLFDRASSHNLIRGP